MKKILMTGIALIAMITISCSVSSVNAANIETQKVEYADSCQYGYVTVSLDMPSGSDAVSTAIFNSLYSKLEKNLGSDLAYGNEEEAIPAYSGAKDINALCQYYGSEAFKRWNASMKAENDENHDYIRNNNELTAEQKAEYLKDIRQYGFEVNLTKTEDNNRYVIFYESVYGYAGGAHGGAYGWGAVTFDKKTGKELKNIIKPGMTRAMQPLLKRGLKKYFCENDGSKSMSDYELYENLMIEGKTIPLPQQYNVQPTKKGIEFVYGQYEIACYAAGMPSFTVPYNQIKPFLTEEAKKVLGLNTSVKK